MARDEDRVQLIHERAQPRQMRTIDAVGAADRDPDRVHGNRIVTGEIRQQFESVRIRQKVLGMDFEPPDGWASGHHLRDVRKPKTDTGSFSQV